MSTRRKQVSGDPRPRAIATGIKVEAAHKWRADPPAQVAGEHLWILAGMWAVKPEPRKGQYLLDVENLVTLTGPGCWYCEQPWTPELAAARCAGEGSL